MASAGVAIAAGPGGLSTIRHCCTRAGLLSRLCRLLRLFLHLLFAAAAAACACGLAASPCWLRAGAGISMLRGLAVLLSGTSHAKQLLCRLADSDMA